MAGYPDTVVFPNEQSKRAFSEVVEKIPSLIKETDYSELYGYTLDSKDTEYNEGVAQAIIFKYYKANEYKVEETIEQLKATLKWRKEYKPLKAGFEEKHNPKYNSIGFITYNSKSPANIKVVTWNLYGAKSDRIKSPKEYFANAEEFTRWRIGLMEQAIGLIDFLDKDNNYIAQIHDYEGVSFLSSDSSVRKVGKDVVAIFQAHYPEFLSTKYFLNFPFILAWVYNSVIKNWFISAETIKKFHILHNGKALSKEFEALGLPKKYGGDGEDLPKQNYLVTKIELPLYAKEILQKNFLEEAEDIE